MMRTKYFLTTKSIEIVAKKIVITLKPFALEFQPFVEEILQCERVVKECADMSTMEKY